MDWRDAQYGKAYVNYRRNMSIEGEISGMRKKVKALDHTERGASDILVFVRP
ncbi:MAG: hypothetical protein NPIRA03_26520 [Nitrospirales bacterium]|nr:MAG: hypothetical protein NPIRA03_26520 [Nitrospirales bacterium]